MAGKQQRLHYLRLADLETGTKLRHSIYALKRALVIEIFVRQLPLPGLAVQLAPSGLPNDCHPAS